MRALVTGGAGFIGSHLVDALVAEGAEVLVLDDLSRGREGLVNPGASLVRADLAGPEAGEAVLRFAPEVVFHLAAQASVPVSLADPAADARTNILGTLNLLEACRRAGTRKVVYASSAAVYGDPRYLPVDEKHPLSPLSPYGVSKYTVELYLGVYHAVHGLDWTALRYANVYGPRQDALGEGGVVAVFVERLRRGEPLDVFGDGEQTRDFIFVGDVVRANLAAARAGSGQALNVGTGRATGVNTLVAQLSALAGRPLEVRYLPARPGDIRHSYLANGEARRALGWEPAVALAEGLRITLGDR